MIESRERGSSPSSPLLFGEGKPIFFDKTGFPPPNPHLSQKNDQRACRPLDSGRGVGSGDWGILAHVIGLDVRHDCSSVPCLAYVTGLDIGNDSDERFYW